MSQCHACRKPSPDATICPSCLADVRADLRQVPWLAEELETTLTRQARIGDRNGPRTGDQPLVFHPRASMQLRDLTAVLAETCRAVAAQRGIGVDAARTPEDLALWLLRWSNELAIHSEADKFAAAIHAQTTQAGKAFDRPADKRYIGPCDDCRGDLYVRDNGDGKFPVEVICRHMLPLARVDMSITGTPMLIAFADIDEPVKLKQTVRVFDPRLTLSGFAKVTAMPGRDDPEQVATLDVDWDGVHSYTAEANEPPEKRCGAIYPMTERRAWLLEQAYNELRTPADITRALGELFEGRPITANLISQWASRGLRIGNDRKTLTPYLPHPEDPHKRPRYLVEEVVTFYRAANGISEKVAA